MHLLKPLVYFPRVTLYGRMSVFLMWNIAELIYLLLSVFSVALSQSTSHKARDTGLFLGVTNKKGKAVYNLSIMEL